MATEVLNLLPSKVTVLAVRAIAPVGPETVNRPALLGEDGPLLLETGVRLPELGVSENHGR